MSQVDDRDYFTFLQGPKIAEVERERQCFEFIYATLPKLKMLVELFGGFGLMYEQLKAQGALTPNHVHYTNDHSLRCFTHLKETYPLSVATRVDVFTGGPDLIGGIRVPKPCLFSLDFNSFSPLRATREKRFLVLLEAVFSKQSSHVHITDSAVNRLGINSQHYTQFFQSPVNDVPSYLHAASLWFSQRYGYAIRRAAWHNGAVYYLLKAGASNQIEYARFGGPK